VRIVIATTQSPFINGGAEAHASGLADVLHARGHETHIVKIPFKGYPPQSIADHVVACRLLDLSESVGHRIDVVIGLKFPAYLVSHPNKVLWILHQHRPAYDLWNRPEDGGLEGTPDGDVLRDFVHEVDRQLIPESRAVFANSLNVARRLRRYCAIDSTPLYHPPPNASYFFRDEPADYFFYPSRLCSMKRQALLLRALALTSHPVKIRFAGSPDNPAYETTLAALAEQLGVERRVEWLGRISEETKRKQYAHALAVVFPPLDEDYGYVTLEAMLSSNAVITCTDSGGPLEFVRHPTPGMLSIPNPTRSQKPWTHYGCTPNAPSQWGGAAERITRRSTPAGTTW
jgi:glycosyltransferase involved in cell wall biosynthesis